MYPRSQQCYWLAWCFFVISIYYPGSCIKSDCQCTSTEYHCICTSYVQNTTVQTTATLHMCDQPFAATFQVDVAAVNVHFEHTFTHEDEALKVTDWNGFELHVKLNSTHPQILKVK
uniref:Uncharacterized protein LOC102809666 n=1 Tax=Saccoglossus kowalevskii TaxID=10224 RepID=A0ABM0MV06_SACKO